MNSFSLSGLILPVSPFFVVALLLWLIPVLFLATLHSGSHDPKDIGKAVYIYLLLAIGLLTVLIGMYPLIASLLEMHRLPLESYASISMLLLLGSALMILLSRRMCHVIVPAAAAVPRAMFYCFFYMVGALLCFGSIFFLLAGALEAIFADQTYEPMSFWVAPLSLLLTGGGLLLGLRFANENKFRSVCVLPLSKVSSKMQSPSSKRPRNHG